MLILVRHGQTTANAQGLLIGRADPPLDEVGRAQAASLAEVAAGAGRVVCSPLLRARQTAAAFGLPVEVDDRWVEMDYGTYDLTPIGDVPPEVWLHWRQDPSWSPPGGESLNAVGVRVRDACQALAEEARVGDVVVVSHVSPVKAAVAWALGVDDGVAWRMHLGTAAICRVALGPRGPTLQSFNDRHHLTAPSER